MLALGIYLLIGVLVAGIVSKLLLGYYEDYEKGTLDEDNKEEIIDMLENGHRLHEILGNNVFWTMLFVLCMLFWLPVLAVGTFDKIKKSIKNKKKESRNK